MFEAKKHQIIEMVQNGVLEIDGKYRGGPSLYFYTRIRDLRNGTPDLDRFLKNPYHLEMLYATLVSWDMNSRGAKMKDFPDFCENITSSLPYLKEIDKYKTNPIYTFYKVSPMLERVYKNLSLMITKGKLVSNSKLLHFLFPEMLMPMDRTNTLTYFYENTGESLGRYLEVIKTSFEIMQTPLEWNDYLGGNWNTTIPKVIDNAIILQMNKSVK